MTTPPPPAATPQPAAPQPAGPLTESQDKLYASLAHFGGAVIVLAFAWTWLGLLAFVPALVIFLVFGKRGTKTPVEAKEALNFQITALAIFLVWAIIAGVIVNAVAATLAFGLNFAAYSILAVVLALPLWAIIVAVVAFSVIGGLKVQQGGSYRYPFAVRLIK